MKFKPGMKIKMKANCSGCEEGKVYVLHYGHTDGTNKEYLVAWNSGQEKYGCSCQHKWLPLTNRGKNPRGKDGRFTKQKSSNTCSHTEVDVNCKCWIDGYQTGDAEASFIWNENNLQERVKKLEAFVEKLKGVL